MFREEKLPVAAQSPPGEERIVEVIEFPPGSQYRTIVRGSSQLSEECMLELIGPGNVVGRTSSGAIKVNYVADAPIDTLDAKVEIIARYGWQLDSEWTDSIGRHARMVTTQPRQE